MATWIGNDGVYGTSTNWNPTDVPDNGGETAVFSNTGATSVTIAISGLAVSSFTFDANAPTYSISLSGAGAGMAFAGAGIVNNSGVSQNLSTGTGDTIQFQGSSSAADATITVTANKFLQFLHTSSGGTARLVGDGGSIILQTSTGALSVGSLEGSGTVVASTTFGGAASHILTVGSLGTSTTFSGILGKAFDGPAAFGLTKVGSGTLTLSGSSGDEYTLGTTVSAGTLKAGVANVFSEASAYLVANGATLDLNGFNQTIGSLGTTGGGTTATVSLGSATLTAGRDNTTTAFNGAITGTGGLTKQGSGTLTLTGTNTYSGATSVTGGTLSLTGFNAINNVSAVSVSVGAKLLVVDAETIGSLAGAGNVQLTDRLTVGGNNTSTSHSGTISDLGALTKIGTGTQTLSGANTYTGATTVDGGTLRVDGSITSATTVNSGGTLGGDGTITQAVTVNAGGHVAPGASPGSLATGSFTLNAGAFFDVEIAGTAPGTQYDQLIVTGTVTLGGHLTTALLSSYQPASGTTFTIIDNDGADAVVGTFAGLSEGQIFTRNGSTYSISYVGGTGNDVVLTALNDAPTIKVQGTLDAVVANVFSDTVSVLTGTGAGTFTSSPVVVGNVPYSVALGDLDGDGDLDALVANGGSNTLSVLLGDGTGGFTIAASVGVGAVPRSVMLGDVNGDGKLDALVANAADGTVSVFIGNGSGGFAAVAPVVVGSTPAFLGLGDFNGDGHLDAMAVNSGSNSVSVLLGNGLGAFAVATTVAVGGGPRGVAIGDIDCDGDLDALVANTSTDNVTVLLGDGAGGFTTTTVPAGDAPTSVALGDIDGDGDLDALVVDTNTNSVRVLIGNGAGGFSSGPNIGTVSVPYAIALGDINGDGALDALITNTGGANVSVLIGNGAGIFAPVGPVGVGSYPFSVALGDIDNARVTTEDTAIVFDAAHNNAITLDDADGLGADETLTLTVAHGKLTLATTAGLTSVTGNDTGSVTLTGSIAELNAAIDGLIYTPATDYTGKDKLTLTLNDLGLGGDKIATSIVPIIVTAQNDAPAINAPASVAATEDTTTAITGISFNDVDAGGGQVAAAFAIDVGKGTLLAVSSGGVTVSGNGTAAMSLLGTVADINAFIAAGKLTYAPAANANGNVTLGIVISDEGHTGSGGTKTASGATTLAIAPVNDAPALTGDLAATVAEGGSYVLTAADLGFADVDDTAAGVTFTVSGALRGSVMVGGVAVASFTAVQLAGGLVSFLHDGSESVTASFNVSVEDGNEDASTPVAQAFNLTVTPVNDAPGLNVTQTKGALAESADTSSAIKVADIAITDPDGGANVLSLSGADKDMFVIVGTELFLKAGAKLDFETNSKLDVTVSVDDASVGASPDASTSLTVDITDVVEVINGNRKDNVLTGTSVSELINGKGGDDTIKGGGGADTIIGGPGADVLKGGAGADVFVFRPGDLPKVSYLEHWLSPLSVRHDTITDFKPGTDVIDLSAIDANSIKHGNQKFHFEGEGDLSGSRGELVYQFYGTKLAAKHTIIMGDTDGDANYDVLIVLKGHHHLDTGDFIL